MVFVKKPLKRNKNVRSSCDVNDSNIVYSWGRPIETTIVNCQSLKVNKSVFSLINSAVNMALPSFAAKRRRPGSGKAAVALTAATIKCVFNCFMCLVVKQYRAFK